MSEGKRPGGLTALGVINFILFGLGLLGIITMITTLAILSATDPGNKAAQEIRKSFDEAGIGSSFFIFIMIIGGISYVLLFLSGIGYLKQKKFLGRTMGNAYALISIVSSVITAVWLPAKGGGGFNLGTIIGLIYPVLTLILLNTTFKEDFIN